MVAVRRPIYNGVKIKLIKIKRKKVTNYPVSEWKKTRKILKKFRLKQFLIKLYT